VSSTETHPSPSPPDPNTHPKGRATQRKGTRAAGGPLSLDQRAGFLPLPLPPPGDPDSAATTSPHAMTWSIAADLSALVQVVVLDTESPPVFGFVVKEADRKGSISIERCNALRVLPGESVGGWVWFGSGVR